MHNSALHDLSQAMYPSDERGRLIGNAPHFHLLRTPNQVIARCHQGLTDDAAEALRRLGRRERGRPGHWAQDYADYLNILSPVGPLKSVRSGPLYAFPMMAEAVGRAMSIDHSNAELLRGGLDEWAPDVALGLPMIAMVVGARAVSICASVRAFGTAHCAGVETLAAYRGRGFGAQAVAAWAAAVQRIGALPFYGTTFDNLGSQALTARLGLQIIGSEFTVACEFPSTV